MLEIDIILVLEWLTINTISMVAKELELGYLKSLFFSNRTLKDYLNKINDFFNNRRLSE